MFPRGFFWGAVFGAVAGVLTILCVNRSWRTDSGAMENGKCMNFFQDHEGFICLAAVFGAIGAMIAVLCLDAVWRYEEDEAGGIGDGYEESQKQAQEHDERSS